MTWHELTQKLKHLRTFGGSVLCIGDAHEVGPIIEKLFKGQSSIFVDRATSTPQAKEFLLEQLSYDLVFSTPHIELSHSGLDLMDLVSETHPFADFVLITDCKEYDKLDLEPNQLVMNEKSLEALRCE